MTLIIFAGAIFAEDTKSDAKDSGLELKSESKWLTVHVKPGVDFSGYKTIKMEDVTVAFKDDWQRDYNKHYRGIDFRIDDKDMKELTDRATEQFDEVFSEKIAEDGRYSLVDKAGKDSLIIKPAIVDLDINGPDKNTASSTTVMVRQAGEATLLLDIYDSTGKKLLATIIDEEDTRDYSRAFRTNRVRNKSEFMVVYRRWVENLLDTIK